MRKYPNVIQCLACKKVLVSNYRHDFNSCGCPNDTFIDGGYDYLRCGGKDLKLIKVLKLVAVKSRLDKTVEENP